ncbi:cytochrome c [Phenylobacterium sp. LjRoot164]|uniref:c-type cytochrome n=1 Tax=unclassified Phenylobacterium TaxID=2640670 RepID=UPI003ECD63AF
MSRVPAFLCAGLVGALALGAYGLQQIPRASESARLTSWPQTASMPGFGDSGELGPSEIADLTEYVLALAGAPRDQAAIVRAVPLYQAHCASCHGLGGEGAEILGTPDLTRGQFRYATDAEGVTLQIWHGTDGRGPMREAARTSRPKG